MVKKWIIILSIITILIAGCILESNYINNSFLFLEAKLKEYKSVIETTEESLIDSEENILFVQNLHEEWHGKLKVLKSLIWHSGLKDIEVSLSRIESYVKESEKTETIAELSGIIDYLEHYSEDFTISLENIL